jgi:hypothetical protein
MYPKPVIRKHFKTTLSTLPNLKTRSSVENYGKKQQEIAKDLSEKQ